MFCRSSNSCCARDMIQAHYRVRHLKDNKVHLFINDTPDYRNKIYVSRLKRRWQNSYYSVTTAAKYQQSSTFTVPVGNGTIVGVELLCYIQTGAGTSDAAAALVTMYVNGVSLFENVSAIYGHNSSTRPQVFPIKINPGDTYYFVTDASNCSGGVNLGIGARLYFDETN